MRLRGVIMVRKRRKQVKTSKPKPKPKKAPLVADHAAPPPGMEDAPPDLSVRTLAELADLAGLHRNSVLNYKRRGIEPSGEPPWSLRDYLLLLRRHGRLGETKPTHPHAQALRSWAFSGGDSADPDDPAHAPPQGWREEQERQGALKAMKARMREQIELETLRRDRIPVAEYKARWQRRAQQVLAALDRIMEIPRAVDGLSELQRQSLVSACRQCIHDVRARIAGESASAASHG